MRSQVAKALNYLLFSLSSIDLFIVDPQEKKLWFRIFTPEYFLYGICMSPIRLGGFYPGISHPSQNKCTSITFCILTTLFDFPRLIKR